MVSLPFTLPPNFPNLGELKKRNLDGYLTSPNSFKSFSLPLRKTLKQSFLNISHPLPSTIFNAFYPKLRYNANNIVYHVSYVHG